MFSKNQIFSFSKNASAYVLCWMHQTKLANLNSSGHGSVNGAKNGIDLDLAVLARHDF